MRRRWMPRRLASLFRKRTARPSAALRLSSTRSRVKHRRPLCHPESSASQIYRVRQRLTALILPMLFGAFRPLRPTQGDEKRLQSSHRCLWKTSRSPLSSRPERSAGDLLFTPLEANANGSAAVPFVIPSEAEGSAVSLNRQHTRMNARFPLVNPPVP
jgi:hypothetical protein